MKQTLALVLQDEYEEGRERWRQLKRIVVSELGPDGFGILSRAQEMRRSDDLHFTSEEEVHEFLVALELVAQPEQLPALHRAFETFARKIGYSNSGRYAP